MLQRFPVIRARSTSTAVRPSPAITRSYSAQSSWVPPAARKTSRSSPGSPSAGNPSRASDGPISSTGPSTDTHSQPARNTTAARPARRRWASLRASPRATSPTLGTPVRGWSRTPAFTTEAWTVPSGRVVARTASPRSAATSRRTRSRSGAAIKGRSDFEHLLLFVGGEVVDLGHELVGELLEVLLGPVEVVLAELAVLLERLEVVAGAPPQVPHRHPGLLGPVLHDLDHLLAAFGGELGERQADDGAVVVRRDAEIRRLDR